MTTRKLTSTDRVLVALYIIANLGLAVVFGAACVLKNLCN